MDHTVRRGRVSCPLPISSRVWLVEQYRRLSGEFEHADVAELGTSCTALSFEIRERRQRTPAERLALADRAASGEALI
jgi:hypothetical protein